MKPIFFLLAFVISITSISQITITETDFPSPGDTAMVSSSNETSLDLVTTGVDAIWDFSAISVDDQEIDTFHNVADADFLYQTIFNNSWLNPDHVSDYYTPNAPGALAQLGQFGIGIESPVQFTQVAADSVYNTGIGFMMQGQSIPATSI
jgi:hypothetical protein